MESLGYKVGHPKKTEHFNRLHTQMRQRYDTTYQKKVAQIDGVHGMRVRKGKTPISWYPDLFQEATRIFSSVFGLPFQVVH